MGVTLLLIVFGDEGLDEDITCAFPVLHRHTCAFVDSQAYLELFRWLCLQVPNFTHIACLCSRVDIDPEVNNALIERAASMI